MCVWHTKLEVASVSHPTSPLLLAERRKPQLQDSTWSPTESCVVLTSISMSQRLQNLQPQWPLNLDGKRSNQEDRWGEAGSLREAIPHELGFLPTSGRLLKSESEDSGVEMASNDHSPSTPVGSEKNFSLDCLDGFQPSVEDSPPPPPLLQSCPKGKEPEDLSFIQDRAYCQNLSVSKKLAQVVQRSQKLCLPGQASRQLHQRPQSLVDLEGLMSYRLHRLASMDRNVDAAAGELIHVVSGHSTPEERNPEGEVHYETSLTMPGQGLRYLEHICQMLEKIAHLQRANLRLQHQHHVMECQIRVQESENEGFSEEAPEDPRLTRVEPQADDPAATEMEEEEEDPKLTDSWHPHHFRARSASDTRVLRSPARNLGNKADCARTSAAHSASVPSLLDQPDGGSHTLPPGMKLKNDHSHWGRVRGLISRITRKSLRANEASPSGQPASSSSQCRTDTIADKEESHLRRRFLPTLGAKKQRLKHLSMR
ncbi:uncharacterized protein C8orf58 homolog isoform X2 [Rhineura floridana]|uniref:uncharacterized protein C8orf58 homolog isoform X2 n=1 Tax=Rhineura floridana TaxID=261503 RepID=UPI002AC84EB8|nr:uncharacterized protein C8orf58 homolog isoform X2 [Rhineura floridana]